LPSDPSHRRTSAGSRVSFCERIREREEAHAVFTGEAQIERLQRSLVSWMDRPLSGSYDEAYAEETRKIGRVHVRVGLPQRYMFTARALIRVSMEAVAEAELGTEAAKTMAALMRALDLELAIMVDRYREHRTGLGLAISHRIVTDHGGTVDVDSRPGRICFRLTVPIGIELHNEPDG